MPESVVLSPPTLPHILAALAQEARERLASEQARKLAELQARTRAAWLELTEAVRADLGDLMPFVDPPLLDLPTDADHFERWNEATIVLALPSCAKIAARYCRSPWRREPYGNRSDDLCDPDAPPMWLVVHPDYGAIYVHSLGLAIATAQDIYDSLTNKEGDVPF